MDEEEVSVVEGLNRGSTEDFSGQWAILYNNVIRNTWHDAFVKIYRTL